MHTWPHQRVLAATGFFLALVLSSSALAEPEGAKDLTIDQKQVADFVVPEFDLKVTAWVDREDDTYQAGDTLQLFIKTNRDAYITVVDVGTSGKVLVLFPNKHASDNRILADKVLEIPGPDAPYDIRVAGPAGQELIKVIATTRPGPIIRADQLSELGPFQSYGGSAESFTKDLAIELKPNAPDAPGAASDAPKDDRHGPQSHTHCRAAKPDGGGTTSTADRRALALNVSVSTASAAGAVSTTSAAVSTTSAANPPKQVCSAAALERQPPIERCFGGIGQAVQIADHQY